MLLKALMLFNGCNNYNFTEFLQFSIGVRHEKPNQTDLIKIEYIKNISTRTKKRKISQRKGTKKTKVSR